MRSSIYEPDRNNNIVEINSQWREYTGPIPPPFSGDFNPYSHKWNICSSFGQETLGDAYGLALIEFENRLCKVAPVSVSANP